jgi:5-methylcytosine-specific restriction endonuclease McrA
MDHILALVNGGKNVDSNIQLLTVKCNLRKGRKLNEKFMAEQAVRFGRRREVC